MCLLKLFLCSIRMARRGGGLPVRVVKSLPLLFCELQKISQLDQQPFMFDVAGCSYTRFPAKTRARENDEIVCDQKEETVSSVPSSVFPADVRESKRR